MPRSWIVVTALVAACATAPDTTPLPVADVEDATATDLGPVEVVTPPPDVPVAPDLGPPPDVAPPDVLVGPPPGLLSVGPEVPCIRGGTPGVFTESREALGVTFAQDANDDGKTGPPGGWAIGGGVAIADFDGDGWLDLAFAQIKGWDQLYLTGGRGPLQWKEQDLIRPNGTIHIGAYAADPNGDGHMDILFSPPGSGGGLALNDGLGNFTLDINTLQLPPGSSTIINFSLAWGDVNADGALDILVAGGPDNAVVGSNGPGGPELLYLGEKGGTKYTLSDALPKYLPEGQAFIAVFVDIDNDHDQDIYVVNDFGITVLGNQLMVNDGTGHFTDHSDDAYAHIWGMGAAVGDFDNDGWMDLWAGTMLPLDDSLLHNNHDGTFDDVTYFMKAGSMAYSEGVSWGAEFIDVDSDGDEDLFVTHGFHPLIGKGNGPGTAQTPNPADQPDVLLINNGCLAPATVGGPDQCDTISTWTKAATDKCKAQGAVLTSLLEDTSCGEKLHRSAKFTCCKGFVNGSKSSGLAGPSAGRDPVEADLDGDGFPDLVVGNLNGKPDIYLNGCSNDLAWLGVRLKPTRSNPNGIGARINVEAGGVLHTREIGSGSSGLFGSAPSEVTIGLGTATKVDRLQVIWLGGETEEFKDLAVRRFVTVWQAP